MFEYTQRVAYCNRILSLLKGENESEWITVRSCRGCIRIFLSGDCPVLLLQGGAWRHGRDREEEEMGERRGGVRRMDVGESGGMTAWKGKQNKTRMAPVIHPAFCSLTIMFGRHSILQYMTSVPDKVIIFLFTRLLLFLNQLNRPCELCFKSRWSNRIN